MKFDVKKKLQDKINIYTDRQRLMQILINFISNAIKYTFKGEIVVSFQLKDQSDNVM